MNIYVGERIEHDGWIEWDGGECPVDDALTVDVKTRDGEVESDKAFYWNWSHDQCSCKPSRQIIAYRLHKPEQAKLEPVAEAKPTFEQLAADYRNKLDYANRKQEEADAANAEAEDKLAELVAAGNAIGLVISVAEKEPELVVTDWQDLQVGDEVEAVVPNGGEVTAGERGVIVKLSSTGFRCNFPSQKSYWYCNTQFERGDVKFIRRPAK